MNEITLPPTPSEKAKPETTVANATETVSAIAKAFADVPHGRIDLFDAFKMLGKHSPDILSDWIAGKGFPKAAIGKAKREHALYRALGKRIRSPQDFATAVIDRLQVRIGFDGMLHRPSGKVAAEYTLANLIDDIISKSYELQSGYPESALKVEVSRWVQRSKDAAIQGIAKVIFQDDADRCEAEWERLGRALVMPGAASVDYAVAVLQTLIWQVKRKMLGLEVTGHLMPILTGEQGNGKTTLIVDRFLKPVEDLYTTVNFKDALDPRNLGIWASYLHVYDEMEKAELADINAVKSAITGKKRTARIMGSNVSATVRQMATSIGMTNTTVGQVMRDPTGMRRYAPLPTGHKPGTGRAGEVDWEALNSIDYAALWRSVQVTDARPADRVADELLRLQEAERTPDPVEYYLRDHIDVRAITRTKSLRKTNAVFSTDLHRDYVDMMRESFPTSKAVNVQSFGMKVSGYIGQDWCPFADKEKARDGVFYLCRDDDVIRGETEEPISIMDRLQKRRSA